MLEKKDKGFINLKREPIKLDKAEGPGEARYPHLYIDNVPLPVEEGDLNDILDAEVKLKVKRVAVNVVNGKKTESFEFDIQSIKFV